jgi:hypothetical protein
VSLPVTASRYVHAGNLLAPYVAACANDLLFSSYQRLRQREAQREQRATLERLTKLSSTMAQLRGAKLARLQPQKPPAAGAAQQGQQQAPGTEESEDRRGSSDNSSDMD